MTDEPILTRYDFRSVLPILQPVDLPVPDRAWTTDEWQLVRRGHKSRDMDDRWNAFVEADRLYLHRSWTGRGIFEAEFVRTESGWRIASALTGGNRESSQRSDYATESALLEAVIEWILLGVFGGPGQARWEMLLGVE